MEATKNGDNKIYEFNFHSRENNEAIKRANLYRHYNLKIQSQETADAEI